MTHLWALPRPWYSSLSTAVTDACTSVEKPCTGEARGAREAVEAHGLRAGTRTTGARCARRDQRTRRARLRAAASAWFAFVGAVRASAAATSPCAWRAAGDSRRIQVGGCCRVLRRKLLVPGDQDIKPGCPGARARSTGGSGTRSPTTARDPCARGARAPPRADPRGPRRDRGSRS